MINRMYFAIQWWKDESVWIDEPLDLGDLDHAILTQEALEKSHPNMVYRIVKRTEEVVFQ